MAASSRPIDLEQHRQRRGSLRGLVLFISAVVAIALLITLGLTLNDHTAALERILVNMFSPLTTGSALLPMAIAAGALFPASVLSQASSPAAPEVDLNWYPPKKTQINDLDAVLDPATTGVYGFVFNTSHTPQGTPYSTYNWCNMPHVRKTEYLVPPSDYVLRYVEVIQRHHKRTPYASNSFPVESYPWNCDDEGLFYYGAPFSSSSSSYPTYPAYPGLYPGNNNPPPAQQQQQDQSPEDGQRQPVRAYWKGTISSINPFTAKGWQGTCQFPQITSEGLNDSWVHGRDLYELYHDVLGFLPPSDADAFPVDGGPGVGPDGPGNSDQGGESSWRSKVAFRVTNNVITSQVAGMFISGMYTSSSSSSSSSYPVYPISPPSNPSSPFSSLSSADDPVPLLIQAQNVDSLEPQYPCSASSSLFSAIKSNDRWTDHLNRSAALFATLDNISGVTPADNYSGFHASFDHYFDNLSARQCHPDKPFPCKLVNDTSATGVAGWRNDTSECVDQDLADTVYRLGQWEYSHIYRDSGPETLAASVASLGVWVAELASHLRARMAMPATAADDTHTSTGPPSGNQQADQGPPVYMHNFAHDGSTSRLLSILQVDEMVWPGMGAEIVFELWWKKAGAGGGSEGGGSWHVRVLFGGQVLRSSNPSLGLIDMLPAETLLAYFDGLVGQKASLIKAKCSA